MALNPLLRISLGQVGSRVIAAPRGPTLLDAARTGLAAQELLPWPLIGRQFLTNFTVLSNGRIAVAKADASPSNTETLVLELPKRKSVPGKKRLTKKPASRESAWSKVDLWVVFSDLHFSRRTRDTCLQVLQTVHAEASLRKAGIIFLGDFWHARGALPVDLLNVVVKELATWICPAIFIPGNHDQVTMSGEMHALMVLGAVNPLIKIFDEPVKFLDALWLPFRRDHDLIRHVLDQHRDVGAIFAHLDVVGASMNEAFQAKNGIEPSVFPQDIPIYTGHYHKPHTVKDTHIEYIGSPYQVSANEFGQSKRFLLLNNLWQKVGEIPIDKGARHFVFSDVQEISSAEVEHLRSGDRLRLMLSSAVVEKSIEPELVCSALRKCSNSRNILRLLLLWLIKCLHLDHHRVMAVATGETAFEAPCDEEKLRSMGVDVSLDTPVLTSKPRIEEAEKLDVLGLFNLYSERVNMDPGARLKGVQILQDMDLPAKLIHKRQVELVLKQVEMKGFGPYLDTVVYPLHGRGIRVVCGKNLESAGADSNGAGKSTLVMAPLWALSGSTDPRPDSMRGLLSNEVIHEKARSARVRVEGEVNGRPFVVERTAGRKPSLSFFFDGEDCTGQDIKLTQSKIDDVMDTTMLRRVAFHGQYGIGSLLEASDRDFKEELSRVIAMDVWMDAKRKTMQDLRAKQAEVTGLEGALSQLRQQQEHLVIKVQESQTRMHEWNRDKDMQCAKLVEEKDAAIEELSALLITCRSEYQNLCTILLDIERSIAEADQVLVKEMEMWHGLGSVNETAALDRRRRDDLLGKASHLAVELRSFEEILDRKRSMLSIYSADVSRRAVCDKCLQAIDRRHFSQSLSQLEEELANSEQEYIVMFNEEARTKEELKLLTEVISEQEQKNEREQMEHKQLSISLQENVNSMRKCVISAYSMLSPATHFLEARRPWLPSHAHGLPDETNAQRSFEGKPIDSLQDGLGFFKKGRDQKIIEICHHLQGEIKLAQRAQAKVEESLQLSDRLRNNFNPYRSECSALENVLEKVQQNLEETTARYDDAQAQSAWLKELDTAFSHTGVQSYVLETALAQLQDKTAKFLDILSGGNLKLLLRPTKDVKRSGTSVEMIDRVACVRLSNGQIEQRSLRQLSGGERRRQALALALGFTEFASQRSGLHCDLLVLDEVLQHLDGEGKARVVGLLQKLPQSTILLVSQTHGDVADAIDLVDVVVKENGTARIESTEALY